MNNSKMKKRNNNNNKLSLLHKMVKITQRLLTLKAIKITAIQTVTPKNLNLATTKISSKNQWLNPNNNLKTKTNKTPIHNKNPPLKNQIKRTKRLTKKIKTKTEIKIIIVIDFSL
jgi:hypothetical protein